MSNEKGWGLRVVIAFENAQASAPEPARLLYPSGIPAFRRPISRISASASR
jgi:hypothetical protein